MMNGSHAATGLLVGVAATGVEAALTGAPAGPIAFAVGGFVTAGAALLPDIDHDESTVTRSAGLVTRTLAEVLQWVARRAFAATRTPHDPDGDGEHRGLIHTPAFAVLLGVLVAVGSAVSEWIGLAVVWLMLTAALRSLRWSLPNSLRTALRLHWRTGPASYALGAIAALVSLGAQDALGPRLGVLVALGMVVHSIGDGLTNSGIPFAWPFRLRCDRGCSRPGCRGQRWRRLGVLPARLRFCTGSPIERGIELTSLLAAGGLVLLHFA